ncbi:flagellar filament capping protein FliD [Aliarcobacter skirrowii]|uniref:Flagellar hook-associated protein 2 n=1 Tax=Aliarcobacter skirrowii CCUG 10374 TaxID=1032239 RepID=A0AAD0SJU1_9BACT|nr:flagellar filament capping protein FliD [Aliarcobacter skirrowii]AXX84051.1 flagellar filament cap protein [Aliarcobacter skirrowii CCUG 10374]KAB0621761.1 flagellar filament capping protein FliD [Aliarcobacter skirrowii CCUG 10374]RXI27014.1 flagellar hook protein FliD [Aliarcobacter skirrowii CCUG 10374]SUU95455.1 Flagellar cap protein [Aliarcobacter skirrowii]HAC70805.1 flagellar hook protein FliD [Aliarcobacter skirrowii]
MAEGILGLGQGQAGALNNDMLEKLKAVDRKATVEPIEKKLEKFDLEREAITNISTKVEDLLSAIKLFSLNQTTSVNAFNQKSASVMGDGVVFDSDDLSSLKTGSMRVQVQKLAQKDVWQSNPPISGSKTDTVNAGIITINGTNIDTSTMSYTKLTEEINKISGVQASLVEDSAGNFRLSIKSTETGSANKINFTGSDTSALEHFGFDKTANNVLQAQDMQLKADGVDYSSSSNTVTIDGLKITATKETGDSTINIENDTSSLATQMKDFADKYNDLRAAIENEIYSSESSIDNKGALRDILANIKNELFGSGAGSSSIFSFGFSLDEKNGNLLFNQKDFENSTKNGTADLEALFAGTPDKKGIATSIDEVISISGVKKSLIDYEINMISREETLKKDKEAAEKTLESRYATMAQQFASYGVIINQMEASFSGLKMMIQQSIASK